MTGNPSLTDLIEGARKLAEPQRIVDGGAYAVLPDMYEIKDLEKYLPAPPYTRRDVTVETLDSFLDYFNTFKSNHSRIFASRNSGKIVGVIDYPQADGARSAHAAHAVTYDLPFSIEWKRWRAIDGEYMPQDKFALFILENAADIREPDAATVLEVATSLQINRKVAFNQAIRMADGTTSFGYTEDDEAHTKGNIAVPQEIALGFPIYQGGQPYRVRCFLRYKMSDGMLRLGIAVHRREHLEEDAFANVLETIEEKAMKAIVGSCGPLWRTILTSPSPGSAGTVSTISRSSPSHTAGRPGPPTRPA